jgi:hypothetical protein
LIDKLALSYKIERKVLGSEHGGTEESERNDFRIVFQLKFEGENVLSWAR